MAPVNHAALIMALEPVWAALIAAAWINEAMNGMQIAGCASIFLAILVNRGPAIRSWLGAARD